MSAAPGHRQVHCRPHQPISEAKPSCPGKPDRAKRSEPRSGCLDSPAQRSYPYLPIPPVRHAECGLIHPAICGDESDTRQPGEKGGRERDTGARMK